VLSRAKAARPDDILVGAAIGLGMTARAAVQGGADFLLALNAGRLRVMGAASNAAMLPLRDSNRFTAEFARSEILGHVGVPVFFGACAMDPRLDLDALVATTVRAGFAGIVNFPSAIHIDGRFGEAVTKAGLGFEREVELLSRARAAGLMTIGYAKTRRQADHLAAAGVGGICLNFGWNSGGSQGIAGSMTLAAAADHARRIIAAVKRVRPDCLCFVEGGPIISPADAIAVCDPARADGYIGGSTLDRLPLEMSVMQTASAFKAAGMLRREHDASRTEAARTRGLAGLIGQSEPMTELIDQIGRLARTELAIWISGEPGAGRTTTARAIHVASRSAGPFIVLDASDPDLTATLFGDATPGLLHGSDGHVVVENAERLDPALLRRLGDWVERGVMERFSPPQGRGSRVRLVITSTAGEDAAISAQIGRLAGHRIVAPPLRARMEDVPLLARAILTSQHRARDGIAAPRLAADGMRALLRHTWPGNVRELAAVLARAATAAKGGPGLGTAEGRLIDEPAVTSAIAAGHRAPVVKTAPDERQWIMDALARCRFRRAETAALLGLSRKTLYNRMKRLGLSP
jgi:predicted TIM-barrel enzyme/DNA-binding NtrC family response regulator